MTSRQAKSYFCISMWALLALAMMYAWGVCDGRHDASKPMGYRVDVIHAIQAHSVAQKHDVPVAFKAEKVDWHDIDWSTVTVPLPRKQLVMK